MSRPCLSHIGAKFDGYILFVAQGFLLSPPPSAEIRAFGSRLHPCRGRLITWIQCGTLSCSNSSLRANVRFRVVSSSGYGCGHREGGGSGSSDSDVSFFIRLICLFCCCHIRCKFLSQIDLFFCCCHIRFRTAFTSTATRRDQRSGTTFQVGSSELYPAGSKSYLQPIGEIGGISNGGSRNAQAHCVALNLNSNPARG